MNWRDVLCNHIGIVHLYIKSRIAGLRVGIGCTGLLVTADDALHIVSGFAGQIQAAHIGRQSFCLVGLDGCCHPAGTGVIRCQCQRRVLELVQHLPVILRPVKDVGLRVINLVCRNAKLLGSAWQDLHQPSSADWRSGIGVVR